MQSKIFLRKVSQNTFNKSITKSIIKYNSDIVKKQFKNIFNIYKYNGFNNYFFSSIKWISNN